MNIAVVPSLKDYSSLEPTWFEVAGLFPGKTGYKILEAILASAEIIQQTLPTWGLIDVAILNCSNLATFAQQLGCGKDTLLRYVKVYQTLGLLSHSRVWRQQCSTTQLTLPLTPYHPSSEILERLNALVSQGRKKQQDLAHFVRDRYLLLYHLPFDQRQQTQMREISLGGLLARTSHLLQKKRVRRVERQILHHEITEVLAQMEKEQLEDLLFLRNVQKGQPAREKEENEDLVSQRGDLLVMDVKHQEVSLHEKGDLRTKDGDLPSLLVTKSEVGGDPVHQQGDLSIEEDATGGDLVHQQGDLRSRKSLQVEDQEREMGDFCTQKNRKKQEGGDLQVSPVAPSSIDSVYIQKDSSQKEFELESKIAEQWAGSEDELSQEAARYLRLLDGPEYATPEYVNTHAGKKALGGYKNKIRRSPRLARVAAINTLLYRTFYDFTRQKKPLESAGRWFHSSFDRYADPVRPMEIIGEIVNWAKSPYTLEEIALVIPRERKRQETQWWSRERLHLPFASCVALHHHLPDKVSEAQRSPHEENQGVTGAHLHEEGTAGLSTIGAMNHFEAEQLADEIRQDASWYLDAIHVCPAPHLGENAYAVEAYIADTLFPVAYRTRQDWVQEHQHQVRHRMREQQRGEIYAAHPS